MPYCIELCSRNLTLRTHISRSRNTAQSAFIPSLPIDQKCDNTSVRHGRPDAFHHASLIMTNAPVTIAPHATDSSAPVSRVASAAVAPRRTAQYGRRTNRISEHRVASAVGLKRCNVSAHDLQTGSDRRAALARGMRRLRRSHTVC